MVFLQVQDHVSASRQCLWDMDEKKAPQDKLVCISRCCQELLSRLWATMQNNSFFLLISGSCVLPFFHLPPAHFLFVQLP